MKVIALAMNPTMESGKVNEPTRDEVDLSWKAGKCTESKPKKRKTEQEEGPVQSKKKAAKTDSNDSNNKVVASHEDTILSKMAKYHRLGRPSVKFSTITTECKVHERTKTWVAAWKSLTDKNLLSVEGGIKGTYQLTEGGRAAALGAQQASGTGGKAEVVTMDEPKTDKEKHDLIKADLLKKGPEMFDLILNEGPISRKDLAEKMKLKSGTHSFSYALKELKDLGYVQETADTDTKTSGGTEDGGTKKKVKSGKFLKLSSKAFVSKE